jgi:hypothetical protein
MFVITADQVDSRHSPDLVDVTIEGLNHRYGSNLILEFDRNSGDEIQALMADPRTTLDIILELTRSSQWSVGCGAGTTRTPLPSNVRSATGDAFSAARDAVDAAKKAPLRFRLLAHHRGTGADPQPLIDLLLLQRSRRTTEGWQLFDLLQSGSTQREAATRLGVSPQAISLRAQSAGLRFEAAAITPLVGLLEDFDREAVAGAAAG